jgi:uncharacterized protein (TIGR00369 family)
VAAGQAIAAVHDVFGVRMIHVEAGHTVVRQAIDDRHTDSAGRLCAGALLVGIDAALGCAAGTVLGPGRTITTLQIRAHFVRLAMPPGHGLLMRARTVHVDDQTVVACGEVIDDRGRLVATISTRCGVLVQSSSPLSEAPASFLALESGDQPGHDGGTARAGAVVDRPALAACATRHFGAKVNAWSADRLAASGTAEPAVANTRGDVQGGALGLFAEQALTAALIHGSPPLRCADSFDLELTFVRGARADGTALSANAVVQHRGRRFVAGRAEVRNSAHEAVLFASGSRYSART